MVSILVINFKSCWKITPLKIRKINLTSKYYISLSLSNMPGSRGVWLQGKDVPSLSPTGLLRQLQIIPARTGSGVLSKWLQLPSLQICKVWSMAGDTFNLFLPQRVRRHKPKSHKCFPLLKIDVNAENVSSSELCRAPWPWSQASSEPHPWMFLIVRNCVYATVSLTPSHFANP